MYWTAPIALIAPKSQPSQTKLPTLQHANEQAQLMAAQAHSLTTQVYAEALECVRRLHAEIGTSMVAERQLSARSNLSYLCLLLYERSDSGLSCQYLLASSLHSHVEALPLK